MMKKLRYMAQAVFLAVVMLFFRLLPLDLASALGGRLGRMIGPLLKAHRVARKNLQQVFPDYSDYKIRTILGGMWENLGRVAAEYPHLSNPRMRSRMTIEGAEHMMNARDKGVGAVFVSGHFANWEMIPMVGVMYNLPVTFIYRAANNPYADRLIQWMRGPFRNQMVGKGRQSVQQMIKTLQNKECVAMLVDQKLNEGEDVPFFGYPVKTPVSATRMAIKYQVPLLALLMVRTGGVHFHATVTSPMMYDKNTDAATAMRDVHARFEQWIRQNPEQWFWVHNRWKWNENKN